MGTSTPRQSSRRDEAVCEGLSETQKPIGMNDKPKSLDFLGTDFLSANNGKVSMTH